MNIKILITTFNRPGLLLKLLADIFHKANGYHISLLIIDDGSSKDYSKVHKYLDAHFHNHYDYFKTEKNYGKKDYWKLIDFAYRKLQAMPFDYLIQLHDDIRLVDGFFDKAVNSFDSIPDRKKACLNILNDYSRDGKTFWTAENITDLSYAGIDYMRTGWVDMCFVSSKNYLRYLNFTILPVSHKWSADKNLSSGVGKQISQRLIGAGKHIYQLKKSIVIHDAHPSVMHPEHRKQVQLITNHTADKITATMATMPGREQSLEETVRSILPQVDELHIYMNNIKSYPFFAGDPKIKLYFSEEHHGDLGDAGKFYTADKIKGYHFTIDDDLIYPPDYVNTMVAAIEKYNRKCAISCHGRMFDKLPVKSYYKNYTKAYSCLRDVNEDVYAHIVGTGVLAYHTDTLQLNLAVFEYTNMADIWFSKFCNNKNIPRVIIAHRKKWIRSSDKYDTTGSIYVHQAINDSVQTQVTNSVQWNTVL